MTCRFTFETLDEDENPKGWKLNKEFGFKIKLFSKKPLEYKGLNSLKIRVALMMNGYL